MVEETENLVRASMTLRLLIFLLLCTAVAIAAPQSYKQIAWDALMQGNRTRAIEYYEKWAEADPTDAISLYNLACCYALEGRKADALTAIVRSAEAGWSDSINAVMDPDLTSLQSSPEFIKALDRMAANGRSQNAGYSSHTLMQTRLGRYVVILPDEYDPAQRYPLVVLLHGYGMSAETFADVAKYINTHDYIYIVPEGSYTAKDSDGKGFSHLREQENFQEDLTSVPATAAWVVAAADDAMQRYPIQGMTAWLVGFSQGAALAHVVAAHYPTRVAGYCAHGGYIIKNAFTDEQMAAEKKAGTQILITHGQDDPAVAIEEGIYASNMLKHAGLDVTFTTMNVPHVFTPEVGRTVGDWLRLHVK